MHRHHAATSTLNIWLSPFYASNITPIASPTRMKERLRILKCNISLYQEHNLKMIQYEVATRYPWSNYKASSSCRDTEIYIKDTEQNRWLVEAKRHVTGQSLDASRVPLKYRRGIDSGTALARSPWFEVVKWIMIESMETRWPPRSPQEALLSSPSGRKKLRMYQSCTSPTPSPLKKAATVSGMPRSQAAMAEEDDEDDEETLQLRLEALEARLKLKKLQQKKLKSATATIDPCEGGNESRVASKHSSGIEHRDNYGFREAEARQSAAIQVMVSPQKRMVAEGARSQEESF